MMASERTCAALRGSTPSFCSKTMLAAAAARASAACAAEVTLARSSSSHGGVQ